MAVPYITVVEQMNCKRARFTDDVEVVTVNGNAYPFVAAATGVTVDLDPVTNPDNALVSFDNSTLPPKMTIGVNLDNGLDANLAITQNSLAAARTFVISSAKGPVTVNAETNLGLSSDTGDVLITATAGDADIAAAGPGNFAKIGFTTGGSLTCNAAGTTLAGTANVLGSVTETSGALTGVTTVNTLAINATADVSQLKSLAFVAAGGGISSAGPLTVDTTAGALTISATGGNAVMQFETGAGGDGKVTCAATGTAIAGTTNSIGSVTEASGALTGVTTINTVAISAVGAMSEVTSMAMDSGGGAVSNVSTLGFRAVGAAGGGSMTGLKSSTLQFGASAGVDDGVATFVKATGTGNYTINWPNAIGGANTTLTFKANVDGINVDATWV